jgi:hypothetical protein
MIHWQIESGEPRNDSWKSSILNRSSRIGGVCLKEEGRIYIQISRNTSKY